MRTVQQILEAAGYETRSYSGRGMFGKECLAAEFAEPVHFGKLFSDVIDALVMGADGDDIGSELAFVSKAFRGMRQDSMGRGTVVYFPRIAFEP